MNKKGHRIIDASSLPMWLLVPLILLVCLVLLGSLVYMGVMVYSCVFKDKCMWGFGYWGPPIVVGNAYSSQQCFTNGLPVNCSGINNFRHNEDFWYNNGSGRTFVNGVIQ